MRSAVAGGVGLDEAIPEESTAGTINAQRRFRRLVWSRPEAEDIARLVDRSKVMEATDFQASRKTAREPLPKNRLP